ncbi:MAG: translation initiation factor IF-6 [Euryarchaeota archaeon]|nr:translation initiation factor IF-6 [Euryarchaeota archaeon]
MLKLSSYLGNPYIGVYCVANESLALVPFDAPDSLVSDLTEALECEVIKATLASTNILGSLMAMNSNGAIVSGMASLLEIRSLGDKIPIIRIKDRLNACGNNILVNDNAALVNPELSDSAVKQIEEVLQIDVTKGTIAGYKTVGSVCTVTNKGVLCHPATSKEELKKLEDLFKVPAAIGTLNYGAPLIGASLIANSKGAAVGFRSTPIELGRVENALYL